MMYVAPCCVLLAQVYYTDCVAPETIALLAITMVIMMNYMSVGAMGLSWVTAAPSGCGQQESMGTMATSAQLMGRGLLPEGLPPP